MMTTIMIMLIMVMMMMAMKVLYLRGLKNQEARRGLERFDGETLTDRLCTLAESSLKLSNADEFSS